MTAVWLRALFFLSMLSLPAGAKRYAFEHFAQEQGLANSLVRALTQDQSGFLWVGTRDGLYRYDGSHFHEFTTKDGLPDNNIRSLHVSREGSLWVGTDRGVAKLSGAHFDQVSPTLHASGKLAIDSDTHGKVYVASKEGVFVAEASGPFRPIEVPGPVNGLWVDRDNSLWMGCADAVCRWDGTTVKVYGPRQGVPAAKWAGFQRDHDGSLIARSGGILLTLDDGGRKFRRDSGFHFAGSDQIMLDKRGRLIAPSHSGIWIRGAGRQWQTISEEEGLPDDRVNVVLEDKEGLLWIGFADLGLARWKGRGEWESWTRADGLLDNAVSATRVTGDGAVWAGSRQGLSRLDRATGKWRHFGLADGLPVRDVRGLALTDGTLWIASNNAGLSRMDTRTLRIQRIPANTGLAGKKILSLWVDNAGKLWVACREGLYVSVNTSLQPKFVQVFRDVLQEGEEIYAVRQDRSGRLWMAGNRGLLRLRDGQWTRYSVKAGLRSNELVFLSLGQDDSVWIGYGNHVGVSRLQMDSGHLGVLHYDVENAILHSNDICFLETDSRGRVWVGTDNGVDVFNGRSWRHFSSHDGLVWHDTVLNAFYEDHDGGVWIGTNLGLSHYVPAERMFDVPPPVVALTSVRFGAEPAEAKPDSIVPYKQRSAKFFFTTLSFSRQRVTRFRYRLHGLDDSWVETLEREAIFPNLAPAKYEFEVQAGADGVWNTQSANFPFRIEAPWWETNWFNGAIILFLALTACNVYLRRMQRNLLQKKYLQEAVTERTRQLEQEKNRTESEKQTVVLQKQEIETLLVKAQEASRLKGEFLANVSHEIRTPMNGILGMTSLALETSLTPDQRDYLEMAKASGEALLSLLNDILDFSKIEANRMELEAIPFSLKACLEESIRTMTLQAKDKGVALELNRAPEVPDVLIGDPTRLRQVLLNLLSNSIKFTNHGWVRVDVDTGTRIGSTVLLNFSVKDSGCGIAADKLPVIFEAFRQADGSTTRKFGGTGLGLAICNRLVGIMGGAIRVQSEVGQGSDFSFTAKFDLAAALPANISSGHELGRLATAVDAGGIRKLRVLVVEDNIVNQKLVVRLLERQGHEVEVASDGLQALNISANKRFDLVLMDVQMPEMDGLETTRRIREREKTTGDHLPILMLTANAMVGDREKGLDAGADGYLPKPVSIEQLTRAIAELASVARPVEN